MAKRIGAAKYMECSAMTGHGVQEVLEHAAQLANSNILRNNVKNPESVRMHAGCSEINVAEIR